MLMKLAMQHELMSLRDPSFTNLQYLMEQTDFGAYITCIFEMFLSERSNDILHHFSSTVTNWHITRVSGDLNCIKQLDITARHKHPVARAVHAVTAQRGRSIAPSQRGLTFLILSSTSHSTLFYIFVYPF